MVMFSQCFLRLKNLERLSLLLLSCNIKCKGWGKVFLDTWVHLLGCTLESTQEITHDIYPEKRHLFTEPESNIIQSYSHPWLVLKKQLDAAYVQLQ